MYGNIDHDYFLQFSSPPFVWGDDTTRVGYNHFSTLDLKQNKGLVYFQLMGHAKF